MLTLPGGGANAVNNLVDLGARVFPVATLGDDAAGQALADYFRKKKVDVSGLVRARGWTTPAKTRFLAGWPHTAQQQVLRVDREPDGLPSGTSDALVRKARERLAEVSAVLISDYGYGSATPEIAAGIRGRKPGRIQRRSTPAIAFTTTPISISPPPRPMKRRWRPRTTCASVEMHLSLRIPLAEPWPG